MKYVLALLLSLLASPALAGVSCVLPFNIQNGQPADATQVMANYNALVACLGNAAAAGANSDITSLNGLTTPIPRSAGGTPVYVGGTSTGSANAQATTTIPAFILSPGNIVSFTAGFSNTGATTFNAQGTGAINVFRRTQIGLTNLVGGEWVAGEQVMLQYDGTQYQCLSCKRDTVGQMIDYAGTSAPAGWLIMDGSCQPQASFPALFAVIGSNFGSCSAGSFALPDGRGNVLVGLDTANRLTLCPNHLTLGALCGLQSQGITLSNLPVVTISATGLTGSYNPQVAICNTITTLGCSNGDANLVVSGTSRGSDPWSNYVGTGAGLSVSIGGSVTLNGGGNNLPTIPPLQFINKIVKL